MYITNVHYVAFNALSTKHIEMEIITAFFFKHFESALLMYIVKYIAMYIYNVRILCIYRWSECIIRCTFKAQLNAPCKNLPWKCIRRECELNL